MVHRRIGTEESMSRADSSVPLTHLDPYDPGLICLVKKRKIRFRIYLQETHPYFEIAIIHRISRSCSMKHLFNYIQSFIFFMVTLMQSKIYVAVTNWLVFLRKFHCCYVF